MSKLYLDNRLKYHAASRVASQQGQALLQALTLDGHTVTTSKVWASNRFPENEIIYDTTDPTKVVKNWKTSKDGAGATTNLVNVFIALDDTTSQQIKDQNNNLVGTIYTNPNYDVALYYNYLMRQVDGSNGAGDNYQAYQVADTQGIRVQDWVSPMAAFDTKIKAPIPGFTGIFQGSKKEANLSLDADWINLEEDSDWTLAKGTWQFMYMGGLLTFNKDYTPTGKSYKAIRVTAFKYIGEYLENKLNNSLQWQIIPQDDVE